MSENEYIAKLQRANPWLLRNSKVAIHTEEMERILRQAFREGKKHGEQSPSLFEKLFGK